MSQDVVERAAISRGTSNDDIHRMVEGFLSGLGRHYEIAMDVGCGTGNFEKRVRQFADRYIGADVIRYSDYPADSEFLQIDLDTGKIQTDDETIDLVLSCETIEHLENPRAFARELTRIARPGASIIVTTPNQLSLLSKLTLILKNNFNAFTDANYPAHITALLQIDLIRIARECEWKNIQIRYTCSGRIPGTPWMWPKWLSRLSPRRFSDNLMVTGIKKEKVSKSAAEEGSQKS